MKRCLILGDAASVYEDAQKAFELFTPDAIIATNNIGIHWQGHVDIICSLHPGPCADWVGVSAAIEQRVKAGRNRPETWGHQCRGGIENRTSDWGGSTGLLAVKIALEKSFDRIVLAGIPMMQEGAHFYSRHRKWAGCNKFRRAWTRRIAWLRPRVKSMSGWTMELLGPPTVEWINAEERPAESGCPDMAQVVQDSPMEAHETGPTVGASPLPVV